MPDAKLLYQKLIDNKCHVQFVQTNGLFHSFMSFNDVINESVEIRQMVKNFIDA